MEKSDDKVVQSTTEDEVDFDQLAEKLGGFGRYQIIIFVLGCVASFMSGLGAVAAVFIAYKNPARCLVPGCDSANSSYNEGFLNFTIPYDPWTEKYEECSMYGSTHYADESEICTKEHFDTSQRINCTEWVYDTEIFTSTIITTFELVCGRAFLASLAGSTFLFGMIFGSLIVGAIADKFGRKIGLIVATLLCGIPSLASTIAPNYIVFLVLRVLAGAGTTSIFQIAFVIAVELVSSKWRAFCGVLISIPFSMGEIATGVFAYYIRDWQWLQLAISLPVFLLVLYYWIINESVRWLVSQNRIDDAIKNIDRAARINNVESPRYLLKTKDESKNCATETEADNEKTEKKALITLLKSPNARKRTLFLFYCWSVCSLNYYGLSTNSGNLPGNIFVSYILTMLVEIPSYFVSYYLSDKIGRKATLMTLYFIGGVSCLVSGVLPTDMNWFIVTLSLLGKFGVAGAFGLIFLYTAELYPTELRSSGVGACSMCSRVSGTLAPMIAGLSLYYQPLPLLIFGALSFLAGCIILFLPETLGAELPQTVEESESFGKDQPFFYFTCCNGRGEMKDEIAE